MVKYPEYIPPNFPITKMKLSTGAEIEFGMFAGEGINAAPFEARGLFDFTFSMGGGTGMVLGLIFQLGKWGYDVVQVSNSITVSPVFTEYYQKTIEEKRKLEEQMKAGFASLSTAISDYELLMHDVRKYKEYLDYFRNVKKAEKNLEEARKKKDENEIKKAESELKRAKHVLRAIFVDQVDAYTGEGISMKTIAVRWPTIISDFMSLMEDYDDPKDIVKALNGNIPLAEATILATKCKLFREWMTYFYDNVKERYTRLMSLAEARKKSIEEYRNALKPVISRYKQINDMEKNIGPLNRAAWHRPDSQALSVDSQKIWAWRPFISPDPFRPPREIPDNLTFEKAGFYNLAKYYLPGKTDEEKDKNKKRIIAAIKKLEKDKKTVPPLPAVPIVDRVLVTLVRQIEAEYGIDCAEMVNLIYENIQEMSGKFVPPDLSSPTRPGMKWPFSPYFIFVEIPVDRTVLKLPNGALIEDIWIEPLITYNSTQNIILGRMIEVDAISIKERREVLMLLGEQILRNVEGVEKIIKMDDVGKADYPEIFGELEKENLSDDKIPSGSMSERIEEFAMKISNMLSKIGINARFFYPGPYEKLMAERMSKMMQLGPGRMYGTITEYLKKAAGVPGAEPKIWI
ncbi:MAG: hypothetical protein KQA31_04235 [Candidatus Aenigmarchaeota archaeon]|nr:hypothetical protein [Candidatus Aenigmarchaeota archaeon]